MIYTGNKIRVSARIPEQTIKAIRANNFVLNRFVNAALETLFFDIDHEQMKPYFATILKDNTIKNSPNPSSKPVQLRIERMFYDKMMLEGFVRNRTINHAINHFFSLYESGKIAEWKLDEIRKAL